MSDYSVPRKALPSRGEQPEVSSQGATSQDLEAGHDYSKNESTSDAQQREEKRPGRWSRLVSRSKETSRLAKEYSGGWATQYPTFVHYKRPEIRDIPSKYPQEEEKLTYRNKLGNLTYKHHDVPVYLSTTTYEPRRLLVQCTKMVWDTPQGGDWRRVKMKGSVPTALKMAEWALRPADKKKKLRDGEVHEKRPMLGMIQAFGRMILIGPFLQLLMALPGMTAPWDQDTETTEKYDDFPGYHWDWPVFAVNKFDMRPRDDTDDEKGAKYLAIPRQVRPEALVVYNEKTGVWTVDRNPRPDIPFVVVSFTRAHFHVDENEYFHTTKDDAQKARQEIEQMCRYVTRQYFQSAEAHTDRTNRSGQYYAYWLDYQCGSEPTATDEVMNHYIDTICDVVRSARKVIIALPNEPTPQFSYRAWGESLWTLSEVLLANGSIQVCWPDIDTNVDSTGRDDLVQPNEAKSPQDETICHIQSWTKLEMTRTFWDDEPGDEDEQPTRILAEHFSGVLSLSRIELFVTALAAFGNRFSKGKYGNQELSRALMAILHHRVEAGKTDSLFHTLARVNMANDNDDLIERMICWSPSATRPHGPNPKLNDIFNLYRLSYPDQFGSRLWNIQPMCEMVGLAREENTVMIDGCRSISIRWKNFPRMQYKRSYGFKKQIAELFVRSGSAWIVAGFSIAFYYLPLFVSDGSPDFSSDDDTTAQSSNDTDDSQLRAAMTILIVGFAFAVGLILSLFGPSCVRRLYGGSVVESTARLVAFEGTMSARKVEEMVFGNCRDRLAWQPSATPLSRADSDIRLGQPPSWLPDDAKEPNYEELNRVRERLKIPQNHKIFTLVDTGRLTISVFSAQYPPSVALLCGRDGGMLRAVLCSWDFKGDCLYKEAVMRMPSEVWESATAKSWLKIRLTSRSPFMEL